MSEMLLEPTVLLSILFWWALFCVIHSYFNQRQRCQYPHRTQKAKAKRRLKLTGLIKKPHCESCAQETMLPSPPLANPPPLIVYHRGRRRNIETAAHYCPYPHCPYYGWLGRGNIRANGHPGGGEWRQLHCVACDHYFLETHDTLFYRKTHAPEVILRAIAALAEGLGIRAVGRVFGVEANTVSSWLIEAAEHTEAVSRFLLHELAVEQVQLDELFALVGEHRAGQIDEDELIKRLARRPRWVWTAVDPVSKLFIHVAIGDRCLAMAQRFVHQVVHRLAPGCHPLFLSDGFKDYATALLTHFGQWVQFPRRQPKGSAPKPRWCALPQLRYAQVVKQCRRRRLVKLIQRVVFGHREEIDSLLAAQGWQINTAFVERLNLTLRQQVAAIGRRVSTLAKTDTGLLAQLHLFQAYYNCCLPHTSLRQSLPWELIDASDRGAQHWQKTTPAMAAGLTDHVWGLRELLLFRVPPWQQAALE